jgi:hypothetical protein
MMIGQRSERLRVTTSGMRAHMRQHASEAAICQWWFDARVYSGIASFILELPGVKSRFYASCPSEATLTKFRATF